jgi:hypothetical protein
MASFTSSQVGLSYPKGRSLITKIVPIARTDSSTVKCVIPKDAVIVDVLVNQTVDASTAAGSFVLGWSGTTSAILSAFSMATTKVGLVTAGTSLGTGTFTKLDSDKQVLATYTVGSSTAGGTGYVVIKYFVAGPGEGVDD